MMSDPLDVVFMTHEERLAKFLGKMPDDLRVVFEENFQRITPAELAQLRADLQAAHERIALRYVMPPFDLTDDATVELARQLLERDERIAELETAVNDWIAWLNDWLVAHPAPAEQELAK
jgi:hypothetical protein